MPAPTTRPYSEANISFNSVQLEDDILEADITLERATSTQEYWGSGISGTVGNASISGTITVALDETTGSPYRTLMAEFITPTSAGVTILARFQAAGTGNQEVTGPVGVSQWQWGGGAPDTQNVVFTIFSKGSLTIQDQS